VKFGIMFANTGEFGTGAGAVALAQLAESLGFESLWTVEHVVVPTGYQSQYPYSRDGKMQGTEASPIPDPLVWLAYVAGATTTIRLATGILILPQRNPLVLAKELATLDAMSGGRLELGVGVGWLAEEFAALGVPFEQRGARTDEYIDILRRVWREDATAYSGAFTNFAEIKSYPKPVSPGGPKIHIGGHTSRSAERAALLGDGFFPARNLSTAIPALHRACAEIGRDASEIEITAGVGIDLDSIKQARDEIGVARVVVPPFGITVAQATDGLNRFADSVLSKL
jgi:probable F420-dependent oxidoreductase